MSTGFKDRAEQLLRSKTRLKWTQHDGGSFVVHEDMLVIRAPWSPSERATMLYVMDLNSGRLFHRQGDTTKLRGRPLSQMVHQSWLKRCIGRVPRAVRAMRQDDSSRTGRVTPPTKTEPKKKEKGGRLMALINVTQKKVVTTENCIELTDTVLKKLLANAGQAIPRSASFFALNIDGNEVEVFLPMSVRWKETKTEEVSAA